MKPLRCLIGWHRWNGGECEGCGETRRCTAKDHFWRNDICEVCGSRQLGPAQIATLVNKIHHKRFDRSLQKWIAELTGLGPIAIPAIIRELLEMFHEYGDLPNPPFTDLRNSLEQIGPKGELILQEVLAKTAEVPDHRAMYKPGQKPWLEKLVAEVLQTWKRDA